MAFRNILFMPEICQLYGSKPCVQYNTSITPSGSGNESRYSIWGPHARQYYELGSFIGDSTIYNKVLAFFHVVRGRAYSFRFLDKGDFTATDSVIDTSAGGTTFQLRKVYSVSEWLYEGSTDTPTVYEHYRDITLPDPSTVFLTLNGDAVPVAENPDYGDLFGDPEFNPTETMTASVNGQTGIITLSQSITSSDDLVATQFSFHVKVRFDTDRMEPTYFSFQAYQGSLPLIEVED